MTSRKQTIIDIFNEMNFKEEISNNDLDSKENTTKNIVLQAEQKISTNEVPINLNNDIEISVKAQEIWKTLVIKKKAKVLHEIGKILLENKFFNKGAEYFEYYSDLLMIRGEQIFQESVQVIFVILPQDFPPFIFCSVVAAALAYGSSVIIQNNNPEILTFKNAAENSGLPKGLFSIISHHSSFFIEPPLKKINHVILYGDMSSVQPLVKICESLKYICPNNTSAILLESCDLNAAICKILMETWGPNSSMWGVSTIIVQESIYKNFVEKLKIQLQNFYVNKKYTSQFKNSIDRLNKIIEKAEKAGGQIIRQTVGNDWSPIVVLQCQDQIIESEFLIMKVLACRTATEGVALLNNTRYKLGTSIWTEISSQALEVAGELNYMNIWVNCHGCFSADKPIRPLNLSGNLICGGIEGIMQFADVKQIKMNVKEEHRDLDKKSFTKADPSLRQFLNCSVFLNFVASQNWRRNNKRKLIMKQISDLFENKNEHCLSEEIDFFCYSEKISDFCENFCERKFFTIQQPLPVGVIALILIDANQYDMISLLTPALVLGNSVIVVLKEKNLELLNTLEIFKNNLPKNVLQVFIGEDSGEFLTSDPIIEEFWLRDESNQSKEYVQKIIHLLNVNLKRYWITPTIIPKSFSLFWRKCLQKKIIWLPKVDKFP